jgi:hypothetical protein
VPFQRSKLEFAETVGVADALTDPWLHIPCSCSHIYQQDFYNLNWHEAVPQEQR